MRSATICLLVAALTTTGCGLLDDVASFPINTSWQTVNVDMAQLGLSTSGATIPSVPCSADPTICTQGAAAGFSCSGGGFGCTMQCATDNNCEAIATAEVPLPIDISAQVRNQTSASLLSKVTLEAMDFITDTNSLSFPTPELSIFVGPNAATSSTSPGTVLFGTVSPIPAGTTPEGTVNTTAAGQSALADFVRNYTAPFKFFVQANMSFGAGDPTPSGKLVVRVRARLRADLL